MIRSLNAFNCHLPFGCRLEKIHWSSRYDFHEKGATTISSIFCDVKDTNFTFKFPEPTPQITNNSKCNMNSDLKVELQYQKIIFRWVSNEIGILEKQFNFTNTMRYFSHFKHSMSVSMQKFKGFDLNILEKSKHKYIEYFHIEGGFLEFYHKKKKITSCKELIDFNPKKIKSIFQMIFDNHHNHKFMLSNVEYKSKICPLISLLLSIE